MSDDLSAQFQQAAEDVTKLSEAPDNEMMLKLYALYKQATKGNCEGKRPGMLDFVGRTKYDAWKALEGKSQDDAMKEYIAVVEELKAADAGKK